ncbi:type II toxin-antitoxin system Phd/YefM family antitoxin [Methyloraptor flagellatus]|jgi:antitoxin (DNA-binding transcriptional repressor) of toxin-antitoxin stability system|uniref:Type II toxin-antitoxin system prevent-host-death family antitoxin n=1 Tax=Methyloraptor flagellatus TaxID=3162530 RepID=A0AAU7XBY3_9HYPH
MARVQLKPDTELDDLVAAARRGESVVLVEGDKPVAEIVPVRETTPTTEQAALPPRVPGRWKGLITLDESFFDPLPDDELKMWEGGD